MTFDWNTVLLQQWEWHWEHQVRDRLAGLTDEEYFWEPAPDVWTLRPRGTRHTPMATGGGALEIDFAYPAPDPAPVTTIAWRLGHVIVSCLAMRNHAHFGAPPATHDNWSYAPTAGEALAQLEEQQAVWRAGVRSWTVDDLQQPVGEVEPYPELSRADLVQHIHRELIHHLAEVALLRDLFARRATGATPG